MKHLLKILSVSLTLAFILTGCQKPQPKLACPFTDMTWESTVDDVTAAEGDNYTTHDSIYNGTTYSFSRKYLDLDGTVKYMFDNNDKLMSVAWAYGTNNVDDLKKTYDKIHGQIENAYGKSGYAAENPTNFGDVWYLDEGDIVLSAVTTDSQTILQYAYVHPKVSNTEP